ncbi:MAG: 3-deoxy-manno-octulosonate cytidylyltransferase [Candidatus Omnitrophica bacterium]|nr:3-deoxy-manno-octulosonate cytidylyltransferase [Candidatus Omnitrophota bacterium]MCB9721286.1 3-deoxy-manno-octulosonate cytidylyltransferase [Candidatus Omnitrophota bacterium]
MNVIGVIPARYDSVRFPGKALAEIDGRPMIQHVYERASRSRSLTEVVVACDDERIRDAAAAAGARVIMTRSDHSCGTDRIVEAVQGIEADIIVNIQGDEPLIQPDIIDTLVACLGEDSQQVMATVIKKIEDPREVADPNVVKVVLDKQNFAIYFSRSPIPYNRAGTQLTYHKHLGIYAYTKSFLLIYAALPKTALEQAESLEQLRAIEHGFKIKTVTTQHESIGVDTPEDLAKVTALINESRGT